MHFAPSIKRCPSASEIAPTGQSGSQVPQFTHELGSIFIAIISTSFIIDNLIYHLNSKKTRFFTFSKYELGDANSFNFFWESLKTRFSQRKRVLNILAHFYILLLPLSEFLEVSFYVFYLSEKSILC